MALGDCCKKMSIAVADANRSGSERWDRQWNWLRSLWLRSLHRCPWCFARINADKTEGGDADEELRRTTS